MANENVLARVYETLLCSPGMSEQVKVDARVDRKAILLLSNVVQGALADRKGLLELVPEDDAQQLLAFTEDCLKKAGLTELSEKLKKMA